MIKVGDMVTIIGNSNIGDLGTRGEVKRVLEVDFDDPNGTYYTTHRNIDEEDGIWYPATSVVATATDVGLQEENRRLKFKIAELEGKLATIRGLA
jgi:hypothetical protein